MNLPITGTETGKFQIGFLLAVFVLFQILLASRPAILSGYHQTEAPDHSRYYAWAVISAETLIDVLSVLEVSVYFLLQVERPAIPCTV